MNKLFYARCYNTIEITNALHIIKYNPITGEKLTYNTWVSSMKRHPVVVQFKEFAFQTYKPPLNRDIPTDFRVTLLKNASHEFGVFRSKGTKVQ